MASAARWKRVEFVENRHVERSGDGAFFLVAVNVKISVGFCGDR